MNKVDVLHVRLTEHAAHQNLPPAIRTLRLRLKEIIQNIYQKNEKKSDSMIRVSIIIIIIIIINVDV